MARVIDQLNSIDERDAVMPVEQRVAGHLTGLDRMIRLTDLADTKAAPLIAAHATVAAVSITQLHRLEDLLRDGSAGEILAVLMLGAIYVVFTALSVTLTVRVFLPKDEPGNGSTLYFADIARMPLPEFIARSRTVPPDELERDALTQTHIVAGVVATKFRRVRLAFLSMLVALGGWLGLMALAHYAV